MLIHGDFNFHLELPNVADVKDFRRILAENNFMQHVTKPTHRAGHMLDLVITRIGSSLFCDTDVIKSSISDHFSVTFTAAPNHIQQREQLRDIRHIDQQSFEKDLVEKLAEIDLQHDVNTIYNSYTDAVNYVMKKHALVKTRIRRNRVRQLWFTDDIHHAR